MTEQKEGFEGLHEIVETHVTKVVMTLSDGTERTIEPVEGGVGVCVMIATPEPEKKSTNSEVLLNASPYQLALGVATSMLKNSDLLPRVLALLSREKSSTIQVVHVPLNIPSFPEGKPH